jgi:DNA-directed RNA polymerase specialized sigma24 family protein
LAGFGVEQEDAEDILQEAWIKLQDQTPPADGNWVPYVLQTVKSLSMNLMRNEANRRRLEEEKWDKLVVGFNLQETDPVKVTQKARKPEQYFEEEWGTGNEYLKNKRER